MSQVQKIGFVASRKLNGGQPILKQFRVNSNATNAYFVGDAVTLNASGQVSTISAAAIPLGVIDSVYRAVDGRPFPLTFNQPNTGPFLATAQEGFATVNIDEDQLYIVAIDASANTAMIGAGALVSAGAVNTRAGVGGQSLGAVTVSAGNHFQIVGIAPAEEIEALTDITPPAGIEVKMQRSIFHGNPV